MRRNWSDGPCVLRPPLAVAPNPPVGSIPPFAALMRSPVPLPDHVRLATSRPPSVRAGGPSAFLAPWNHSLSPRSHRSAAKIDWRISPDPAIRCIVHLSDSPGPLEATPLGSSLERHPPRTLATCLRREKRSRTSHPVGRQILLHANDGDAKPTERALAKCS
jgi:hypothetical protein